MIATDSRSAASVTASPSVPPLLNWSEDQLIRLEYEWRRLQRAFAYHPHVRIVSTRGEPPSEYELEFKVRTLALGQTGELEYAESAPLRVWLPPQFPYAAPVVRPMIGLFHPNLSWEAVHLGASWQPTDTLVDHLRRIGELLAWRVYDPESVVNSMAMDWLEANAEDLPLDDSADFSPEAGGEPLDRVCRHGPETLRQIDQQIQALREALLGAHPVPNTSQVREFSRRTRMALNLFMETDIPEALRQRASRLDEWVREAPACLAVWEHLRRQAANVQALRTACAALAEKRRPLEKHVSTLEALSAADPQTASDVFAALPDSSALEEARLKLLPLVQETQELFKTVQGQIGALNAAAPPILASPESQLARELLGALESQSQPSRESRESAVDVIDVVQPALARAQAELLALHHISGWREYLDLLQAAHELEEKLTLWGSAGVQACYAENASGRFGPFQLEEPIDLGETRVAVRSAGANVIDLIDARTAAQLAHAENGSATVNLPAGPDATFAFTFRLSDRCEDLASQFDFLIRQSGANLAGLVRSFPAAPSWCGRFLQVLGRPESLRDVRDEHRKVTQRCKHVLQDLRTLTSLKARIETWNLVQRTIESAPRAQHNLSEEQGRLRKCRSGLAGIVARCGRDLDTGLPIIAPHLAGAYERQARLLDRTSREIDRLEQSIRDMGTEVAARMSNPRLFGSAEAPQFAALWPLSPELAEASAAMTDDALDEQLARLEELLNVPLRTPAWQAARQRPPQSLPTVIAFHCDDLDGQPAEVTLDVSAND